MNMTVSNMTPGMVGSVLSLDSGATTSGSSLNDVAAKLTDSLTKGGFNHLNDSPLGKMVEAHMDPKALRAISAGSMGMPLNGDKINEAIRNGVTSLIHDKLGPDFGAAADLGISGGSGGAAGGSDLMSKVLNGLGKASLDGLLKDDKKGGATFSSDDKPAMTQIAKFMDAHPDRFPPPDDATNTASSPGKKFSWQDEILKEGDTYLNKPEAAAVRAAADMVGSQLDGGGRGLASEQYSPANAAAGGGTPYDPGQLLGGASGGQGGNPVQGLGGNNGPDLGALLSGYSPNNLEATPGRGQGSSVSDQIGMLLQFKQRDLMADAASTAASIVSALTQSSSSAFV